METNQSSCPSQCRDELHTRNKLFLCRCRLSLRYRVSTSTRIFSDWQQRSWPYPALVAHSITRLSVILNFELSFEILIHRGSISLKHFLQVLEPRLAAPVMTAVFLAILHTSSPLPTKLIAVIVNQSGFCNLNQAALNTSSIRASRSPADLARTPVIPQMLTVNILIQKLISQRRLNVYILSTDLEHNG